MLSKSAARKFFLLGTAACSVAFVLLTIDTIRRVPAQTKVHDLTETAIRGKHLFDKNNCMGCHTILGEGAYYAPELTKVYERRGPEFIKAILKNPEAMYPGQRKMRNYGFSDQEIEDLVAFLKWIGDMDLNGFPPKPDLAPQQTAAAGAAGSAQVASLPQPAVFKQVCVACHSLGGSGGTVGPALDDVGSRRDRDYLSRWLKNPADIKADSKMPNLGLADGDIQALVAFLSDLKAPAANNGEAK